MRLFHVSLITLALAAATPALAQTTTTSPGATNPGVTNPAANNTGVVTPPVRSDRDEHHDYGWIGLLGLAGLAGLMRRNHRVVPGTTHNVTGTGTGAGRV
ncbi:WGxxGxxG family protein [Methylobacterium sp.]|uniref:WGxxGxxG family protein n=1 Tax=Methylobacterium sp. TaxID=409 RepID=UPI0026310AD4|nr:WGxxGxxG family protein [Methylobacterium sp.]MDB5644417.1 hypothetical protein [Methylobacterium sp.]